ncbi:Uncharacterised protein [uncultured archaeon]|nr:Uncharacterised protein [uncultured archaeon]
MPPTSSPPEMTREPKPAMRSERYGAPTSVYSQRAPCSLATASTTRLVAEVETTMGCLDLGMGLYLDEDLGG